VAVVDVEAMEVLETVEAVGPARIPQVMVTVVAVVVAVVVVAVVVEMRLLSTEPQPPEECVISIGPQEPAIAASTAPSSTRQESRRLNSARNTPPTFSP
jgi:hypothetical protein